MDARTRGIAALLSAALLLPAHTLPAQAATDVPTWAEVEAAKQDERAAEAEAVRISAALDRVEAEAARLGDDAVRAAADAETAERSASDAQARLEGLRTDASAAQERADEAAVRAGAITASLARAGDPLLGLWLDPDAEGLLERVGRMSRVAESVSVIRTRAETERSLADALTQQADVAARERERLAAAATRSAQAAGDAEAAADARLAETQARSETLYAQLALLRDTSAELERRARIERLANVGPGAPPAGAPPAAAPAPAPAPQPGGGAGPAPAPAPPPAPAPVDDLGAVTPGAGSLSPADARAHAAGRVSAWGWGDGEYQCLALLWNRESSWRWNAYNASSGAYGIPQSLPGSKMASAGADWRTNAATQIEWGLGYISARYGTPCAAWAHSERVGWY